jgi:hypothetical protein
MPKIDYKVLITSIIVTLIVGGISVNWLFTKDNSELIRDGVTLAKHRWHIESQRTYITKNSWYRINVMCPRIISNGGHETTTRCYYPPDTYEQLSRSLLNTKLTKSNDIILRNTPYYRYGSRGSYAGFLEEFFYFKDTQDIEEFPESYQTFWTPKDTRNYKMVWRVWDLKNLGLSNGNYTGCRYSAEFVKIDLGSSCKDLDYAEVKGNSIWFYFNPQKGIQKKELSIVDPAPAVFLYIKTLSDGVVRTAPLDLENGTQITVIANTTSSNITVCISADHPDVGINASCGINSTEYNWSVNSGSSVFLDGTTIQNVTWSVAGNQTVNFKSIRNNSEVTRLKIDIKGFSDPNDDILCFQETANVSVACGGLSTGSYGWEGSVQDVANFFDENYTTYAFGLFLYTDWFYVNYTKPSDASSTLSSWQVKRLQSATDTVNISIPASCWNNDPDKLIFRVTDSNTGGTEGFISYCANSSGWVVLENISNDDFFYEEAMWWLFENNTYPKNLMFDFNNDSTIDQATFGELQGNTIYTYEFNGSNSSLNLSYNDSGVLTFVLKLPSNLNVTNATFNISGEQNTYPKGISEAQSKESDGTTYQAYSPGVAHKDGSELLYAFGGDCLNLCGDDSRYNTTAQITIGGGLGGVTYKTNVPYKAGIGNCVVYAGSNFFYVIGGYDGTDYYNTTYRYRTVPEAWTTRSDMPVTKAFAQCVLKDDAIYIGGGYTDGAAWNKSFWKFNITGDAWTQLTDLPDGKEQGWAEVLNDTHLLFYGGTRRGSTATGGKTYEYNIAANTWNETTASPSIWTNSGGKVADTIYLYGGVLGGASTTAKTIYRYNREDGNWSLMDSNITGSMYENDCDEKEEHIICLGSGDLGYGQFQESIYHYPVDIGVQILDSPNVSYTDTGDINNTWRNVGDIASEINTALSGCTADNESFCYITVFVQNIGGGTITISGLNITTNLTTIDVGRANVTCSSTYCNQSLRIQNDQIGIVEISNVNSTWLGTHNITWNASTPGNGSLDPNSTTGITTIYHSKFLRTLPYTWTTVIFFMPQNFNQKNISAFGQSTNVSILNITSQAQDKTFNLTAKLNRTYDCLNVTIANNTNKTSGSLLDNSSYTFLNQLTLTETKNYWMWADLYNCNASVTAFLKPKLLLKSCCDTCVGC